MVFKQAHMLKNGGTMAAIHASILLPLFVRML